MALLTNEAHFLRFRVFFKVVWFSEDEDQIFFVGKDLVLPQENLSWRQENSVLRVKARSNGKPRPNDCNRTTQHCWAQHVVCIWPPCCDVLGVVGSDLTIFKLEQTIPDMSQCITTRCPNCILVSRKDFRGKGQGLFLGRKFGLRLWKTTLLCFSAGKMFFSCPTCHKSSFS